jgi:hypothetical protein
MAELGPTFPTVSTAGLREVVESDGGECKARSNTSLTRVAKNPAFHMASVLVHSTKGNRSRVFSPRVPGGGRRKR